jgi:hypothetical protein
MEILAYILEQRAFLQKPSGLKGNVALCFFLIYGMGSICSFFPTDILLGRTPGAILGDIFWGSWKSSGRLFLLRL